MKALKLIITAIVQICSALAFAQNASSVQINSLLMRIPIPESSIKCYSTCTTITDPSNGSVSIKNNGAVFISLNEELDRIVRGESAAGQNTTGYSGAAPTQEQIEQMKQKAMQMQQMTPEQIAAMRQNTTAPSSSNVPLMKRIGEAQSRMMQLQTLSNELSMKMAALDNSKINKVAADPACPDVKQGGDYAGPTCACQKKRALDYANNRVKAMDDYLQQLGALLKNYVPKIEAEISIVDKLEADYKYGEGISDPLARQQLTLLQRQAMGVVPNVLGISNSAWSDGAKIYAEVVNAKSGASVGCFGRN
ncbi:MAG: hypothetical protein ACHQEM_09010 [Chitinophagales bacterium]